MYGVKDRLPSVSALRSSLSINADTSATTATTVHTVLDAMTDEQFEIAARLGVAQVVGEEIRRYRLGAKR